MNSDSAFGNMRDELLQIGESIRKRLSKEKKAIILAVLVFLLFLFVYRNLPFGRMFAFADLPPLPDNPSLLWSRFVSVWQNEHLGFPLPEISFQVIVSAIVFMVGDPNIVQKTLLLSAMPCAMTSMYIFIRRFVKSDASKFLASVVYGLNPVTIGRIVNGGPLDVLFLYAALPLLWLQLTKIVNERRVLDVLLLAVLFGIFGSLAYAIFWAIVPFGIVLALIKLARKQNRNRSFFAGIIMLLSSICLGLLLVLPDILLALQRNETLLPQSEGLFAAVDWAYSTPTPLNLISLAGNGGDLMMRLLGYNETSSWTLLGLVVPLIAFSSILFAEREKKEYILLFLTLFLLPMVFILLTRLKWTYPLFQALPALFSLKNPVKLMYPMSLAVCSLFGMGLDGIVRFINKANSNLLRRNVMIAISHTLVFLLIFLYLFPVIGGGTVGLNEVYGDSYYVPPENETVLNWINEQRQSYGHFRTLWLPYDYPTQIRLEASDPYNVGLRSGAAWLDIPNIDFVRDLFETICNRNTERFCELLRILDVKYVIIDISLNQTKECTIVEKQVTPWIVGNSASFQNFLKAQKYLNEVKRVGNLVVYENREFEASYFSIYGSSVFLTAPPTNEIALELEPLTSNLLCNPDFENGLKPWWTDERVAIDNQTAINGSYSARVTNLDKELWASIAQSVPIEQGGTYDFSVWIKTENVSGTHIKLVWLDENKTTVQTDYIVEKGQIEDTTDWLHVTNLTRAPKNAVTASIRLIGGLSHDGQTPAITWFDNAEFYETPSMPSDSFAQNFLSLCNAPGFYSSENLVVYERGLPSDMNPGILNVSNAMVFSHPTVNQLKEYADLIQNQKILMFFEAETLNAPSRHLLLDNSMSNGEAIQLSEKGLFLEFYAPTSAYYRVSFNGVAENTAILMDNATLKLRSQRDSEAIELKKGYHNLTIVGNSTILDQIQIMAARNTQDLENFFGIQNSKNDISSIETGRGNYNLEVQLEKPAFVVLGESYHPDWKAYLNNESLQHFRAFDWSNAYYVPKPGTLKIQVLFTEQQLRDISIVVWGFSWVVITLALVATWIRETQRRKKRVFAIT
jgi:hypothetical protein